MLNKPDKKRNKSRYKNYKTYILKCSLNFVILNNNLYICQNK